MRSVAMVTTVASQPEDPGVPVGVWGFSKWSWHVLPVSAWISPASSHSSDMHFGERWTGCWSQGVKDSVCWRWQSLSNLVWCTWPYFYIQPGLGCLPDPPAGQTTAIRKQDTRAFNNPSFSLSLWRVSVTENSVCVCVCMVESFVDFGNSLCWVVNGT